MTNRTLDPKNLSFYFLIGAITTGLLQGLLQSLGVDDFLNYGFIASNPVQRFRPQYIIYDILIRSMLIWVLYYSIMYLGFRIGLKNKYIFNSEHEYFNDLSKARFRILYVFSIAINITGYFHSESYFIAGILKITSILPLLLILNLILLSREKNQFNKIEVWIYCIIYFIYLLIESILLESRGTLLLAQLPIFILFILLSKKKFSVLKILLWGLLIIIPFLFISIIKFSDDNFKYFEYDNFILFIKGFKSLILSRLNNLQSLYWILHDQEIHTITTFQEINITFFSLFNNVIPKFLLDFSHYNYFNDLTIEQYLFEMAVGKIDMGGYALPLITEAYWVTNSVYISLIIVFGLYFVLGLGYQIIINKVPYGFLILLIFIFQVAVNPERINTIFYLLFRSSIYLSLAQLWLFKKINIK